MVYFLGVDGGGTGCRAAVAAADGPVLGTGEAEAANIGTDPAGARANILEAARRALDSARLDLPLTRLVAVLGLAGANVAQYAGPLSEGLPFARYRVASDALIAARGALAAGDGITAAIGTGSVFAAQRGGVLRIIGGWGFLLGDHASGARLGRDLLEAALRAQDGLGPTSPLAGAVVAEAGGPEAVVAFAQSARPAGFASYAPRIVMAAAAGDAVAAAILGRAEADVAAAIDLLLAPGPVPICFLGGLGSVFAERLAGRYGALIRPARGTALDGAIALAREL